MRAAGSTAAPGFRPDIQGLRAVAVVAVLGYHAGLPFASGGYVGVDVFFVLSGFLITTHLLESLRTHGTISLRNFYSRRAKRILPAAFLVLGLSVLAAWIFYPPVLMPDVWKGAVATALYVPNYLFAIEGTDYLSESTPSLFQHYWSLGIEEQFYLIWPVLLLLLFRYLPRRRIGIVLIFLTLTSFTLGVLLTFKLQPLAFFTLPSRAWELAIGGLVAFFLPQIGRLVSSLPAVTALKWFGLCGIAVSIVLFSSDTAFPGYAAALPALSTALVLAVGQRDGRWAPDRFLASRPMLFLGAISYSLYLVHWPILIVPQAANGFWDPLPLPFSVGLAIVSVPVAWLVYRFVENPLRTSKSRFLATPSRVARSVAAASAAAVLLASTSLVSASSRPQSAETAVPPVPLSVMPDGTDFVPANVEPELRGVHGDQATLFENGCHRDFYSTDATGCLFGSADSARIVLFGDSHAAQWFPALHAVAMSHDLSLETYTKSSCPSVDIPAFRNGVRYEECGRWRSEVLERLAADPPALVVISNFAAEERPATWPEGMERTLDALRSPVVLLADTPHPAADPTSCLSRAPLAAQSCARAVDDALASWARSAEMDVARAHGAQVVDLQRYFCNTSVCPSIVGNKIVYRDAHHMTATFSAALEGPLSTELEPLIARIQSDHPSSIADELEPQLRPEVALSY